MKLILCYILYVFAFSSFAFAQSGWVQQNPLPTGSMLFGIEFLNDNTGFMVGENVILKTVNGGQSFMIQNSPLWGELNSVCFVDNNTGYVVGGSIGGGSGNDGVILKTINGGNSWTTLSSGLVTLWGVCFINTNTGYATGANGTILKTVNAGQNWANLISNTTTSLWSVTFLNDMTGYVVGGTFSPNSNSNSTDGLILKTTNGGTSWSYVLSILPYTLFSIMFPNSSVGYACGSNGTILKTTNGGSNWTLLSSGTDKYLFGLHAIDASVVSVSGGAMNGNGGTILRTTNGGANWSCCLNPSDTNSFLISVIHTSVNTGYASGMGGKMLKTINGGANWTSLSTSATPNDIVGLCFINDIGFGIANDSYNASIIYTSNGGNVWTQRNSFSNCELNAVSFGDANTGYVCGRTNYPYASPNDSGIVMKTTNSGITWVRKLTTLTQGNAFYTMYFADNNTGYVLGGGNSPFYKTTNGGNTWINFNIAFNYCGVMNSSFVNANTGFIGGCGNVGRTTDGGSSWIVFDNVANFDIKTVFATSQNTVYAAGMSNIIYKSVNGGINWSQYVLSSYPNVRFTSMYFPNSNTGYLVGYENQGSGRIFSTINAGNSWTVQEVNTSEDLNTVFFVSANTGYAAGRNGVIFKTTTAGIGIKNISTEVPKQFSLMQNYPNPFNPTTKFNIQIAKFSAVKVIVFDILGREIAILVNEQLKPGTYQVDWDGSSYSSGVYFYKLIAGDFAVTKKMILMK